MRYLLRHFLPLIIILPLLLVMLSWDGVWKWMLSGILPDVSPYLYPRVSLWQLVWQHTVLVAASSTLSVIVGIGAAIFVTRPIGRDFLAALNGLVSVGQTFPPVAVLALAVPALGFGAKPTIAALFLYGLLPIVRNTISGLQSVSPEIREAAFGMGMNERQTLFKVEIPLALPVVLAGIRTSVIINIGTATIGATIGAGGLGAPIITGLASANTAFILQGSLLAALFAILVDTLFEMMEKLLTT